LYVLVQGGYDMIAHHIAATLSIWLAITSRQGHFYVLAMLATEVTTPFVNLRWHLDVAVGPNSVLQCYILACGSCSMFTAASSSLCW
jgi:TLC domain